MASKITVGDSLIEKVNRDEEALGVPDFHKSKLLSHGERTDRVVVIFHGLTESPAYLKGIAEYFFRTKNANVLLYRLRGHHESPNRFALKDVRFPEWIEDGNNALSIAKQLGNKITLIGFSLGGIVSMNLALNRPNEVHSLVLLAPGLMLSNFLMKAMIGLPFLSDQVCASPIEEMPLVCKYMAKRDAQFEQIVKEGHVISLGAFVQVKDLIQYTVNTALNTQKTYHAFSNFEKYALTAYSKLKIPVAIIDTEKDSLVNFKFNREWIASYSKQNRAIHYLYPASSQISHVSLAKSNLDCYKQSTEVCNPQFNLIIQTIESIDLN